MPQSGFEDGFTVASSGSLDTWVKEIHAKVPGAIEGYIYDQLKAVISDFFQRTKAWRDTLGPYDIAANDGVLYLNPVDAYSKVIQVLTVAREGHPLVQINQRRLSLELGNSSTQDTPYKYYLDPYDTINLSPVNAAVVDNIYVAAILTPRLLSDNRIHQWIIDQHYESILAGAYHRLYQEPGKSYSNTTAAEYWGKKYRSEMVRARSVASQSYGEGPQPWSYNQWAM